MFVVNCLIAYVSPENGLVGRDIRQLNHCPVAGAPFPLILARWFFQFDIWLFVILADVFEVWFLFGGDRRPCLYLFVLLLAHVGSEQVVTGMYEHLVGFARDLYCNPFDYFDRICSFQDCENGDWVILWLNGVFFTTRAFTHLLWNWILQPLYKILGP